METDFNKRQNRKVTIFAIVLSILSIGLLIFGFMLVSSDKVVMLQSISNLSNKIDKFLDNNSSLINKISTSDDIGIRTDLNLKSLSSKISLSFDYLENKKDQKSKLEFDTTSNGESLLGLDLAINKDNLYLYVDNITPDYYHNSFNYISFLSSLSESDYDKLLALLKEIVTDYIDNNQIQKQKVEILYNDKAKRVNKLTYKITNETIVSIFTSLVDSVKNDTSLLESIASFIDKDKKEVISYFDCLLVLLNKTKEIEYYYHVYYYGFNKIVQYELEDINNKTVFGYKVEDNESIYLSQGDVEIFKIEITNNKMVYDYSGFVLDKNKKRYSFSGSVIDNKLTFILKYDDIVNKFVLTSINEEKDNSFNYNFYVDVYEVVDNNDKSIGTIDCNILYYFNQKTDVNVTNSIDFNQITQEEVSLIKDSVVSHPIYQFILELFSNIYSL